MTNAYYTASGTPGTSTPGSSAPIRSEFLLIQSAFDKMPVIGVGNAGNVIIVNTAGTAMVSSSALIFDVSGNATFSGNVHAASINTSSGLTLTGGTINANPGPLDLQIAGATAVDISTGRNVTINSPSSGQSLTVSPGATISTPTTTGLTGFAVLTSGSFGGGIGIYDSTNQWGLWDEAGTLWLGSATGTIGTGLNKKLSVTAAGNVTINAPSSGNPLTLNSGLNSGLQLSDGTVTGVLYTSGAGGLDFGTTTAHTLSLYSGNAQRVAVGAAGNVTINAPSSGTALTIVGAASSTCVLAELSAAAGYPTAFGATASAGVQIIALSVSQTGQTTWQLYQPASSSDLRFYAGADRVILTANGNVTINSPSSGAALNVNGVSSGGGIANFYTNSTTDGIVLASNLNAAGGTQFYVQANNGAVSAIMQAATTGNVYIGSSSSHNVSLMTAYTARVSISAVGNVTINAPSSGTTLHIGAVAGNIAADVNADGAGTYYEVGFRAVPQNVQSIGYTLVVGDRGKSIYTTAGVTVPNAIFGAGDVVSIVNNSGSSITITQGASVTMYLGGTATTGNRTLAQRGVATVYFGSGSVAYISGAGVS